MLHLVAPSCAFTGQLRRTCSDRFKTGDCTDKVLFFPFLHTATKQSNKTSTEPIDNGDNLPRLHR